MSIDRTIIPTCKPYLPELSRFHDYLQEIWERNWVTNHGPLVSELEKELSNYLGIENLLFVSNGTIALQIAIKGLELKGEIITTPFSYVATTNAIIWESCKPVFADICPKSLNIEPNNIRSLINENTSAILATHTYGNPCSVFEIEQIANENNLKVIYDGAHSFGVEIGNRSALSFGDISTCSFHATKLFHTIEGGAVITNDQSLYEKLKLLRQFGHSGDNYYSIGINAKNNELNAAMGLLQLPLVDSFIKKRRELCDHYNNLLKNLDIERPLIVSKDSHNYSYYPVIFQSEEKTLKVKEFLETKGILARRYFYPSLNKLPFLEAKSCPISESISCCILALPLYYNLEFSDVEYITKQIMECL